MSYPKLIETALNELSRLPGVGRRSAERMVFWLLNHSHAEVRLLAESMTGLKEGLRFCRSCNNLSEEELCLVCLDPNRDCHTICIVENPKDLLAIEKTGAYKGRYHVLLGNISPADGRGPDDLRISQLIDRIGSEDICEIVIATDPDSEGEMTALYLIKKLKPFDLVVSRIGVGLPVGSSLEFADISTLSMSLNARREIT